MGKKNNRIFESFNNKDREKSKQKKQELINRRKLQEEALKVGLKREKVYSKSDKALKKSIDNRKQYNKRKADISQKRMALQKKHPEVMERGKISDKNISKISWSDIDNNTINREDYPFLFPDISNFDFDRVYKLKDGESMFFAYRDYTGETEFGSIIADLSRLSNETLLDILQGIVDTPISYSKKNKGESSGKAGDYRYECGKQNIITETTREAYNINRRKATRTKDIPHPGFQVLKNGSRNSFSEVTPRNLLIIANAIMYNVTELERIGFYKKFRADVVYHIPEMNAILPRLEE